MPGDCVLGIDCDKNASASGGQRTLCNGSEMSVIFLLTNNTVRHLLPKQKNMQTFLDCYNQKSIFEGTCVFAGLFDRLQNAKHEL